ncbi:MAG: DUF2252 domain-containing protein [Candidatus Obscuribacterales bacterium]|nr:DUF2252 domain-containing protein [Candidatus Obscuribacterales bacterium]
MTKKDSESKKASKGRIVDQEFFSPDKEPIGLLPHMTRVERKGIGRKERHFVPRDLHGHWATPVAGRDVVRILEESNEGRMPELIPIRYGRMAQSSFAFYRGSAALMAFDLSNTATTSLRAQLCGDCHVMNFGIFATPERRIILDINDFDETLQGPFEWDLKRLTTSFVLAARHKQMGDSFARRAAYCVAQAYRNSMKEFTRMRVLDVWYAKFDLETFVRTTRDALWKKRVQGMLKKAQKETVPDHYFPKMTHAINGRIMIKDNPPLIFHTDEESKADFEELIQNVIKLYKDSLQDDRRVLVDKYRLQDVAHKVVGVGSVGTRCGVALLTAAENDPLILQYKEARMSVLEPYCGKSPFDNHAERIVNGQRLMQAASDIFLGWTKGRFGHDFYLRQLRDAKLSLRPEIWDEEQMIAIGKLLGWVLARAHARGGDPVQLSAYMGNSDEFDNAIANFSMAYANQTELDFAILKAAIADNEITAYFES